VAGLPAVGFGTAWAGLFFNALRALAGGADFARAGADGFDFAATFLDFDAALAMVYITRKRKWVGGLTPRFAGSTQAAEPASALHVKPLEQAEADQADANQIDRNHEIEEARHDQDQDASKKRHDRLNVGCSDDH
jgi:hypothetical protein